MSFWNLGQIQALTPLNLKDWNYIRKWSPCTQLQLTSEAIHHPFIIFKTFLQRSVYFVMIRTLYIVKIGAIYGSSLSKKFRAGHYWSFECSFVHFIVSSGITPRRERSLYSRIFTTKPETSIQHRGSRISRYQLAICVSLQSFGFVHPSRNFFGDKELSCFYAHLTS